MGRPQAQLRRLSHRILYPPTALRMATFERRLCWIFGSPRSGSTWLLRLLNRSGRVVPLDEPLIGFHLAPFAPSLLGLRAGQFPADQLRFSTVLAGESQYFFSDRFRSSWGPRARGMILDRLRSEARAKARMAKIRRPITVVKEPNGSQAADMIMSLLPESRLIFLVRDGRDAVDSVIDAVERGTWLGKRGLKRPLRQLEDRLAFVEDQAHTWTFRMEVVQSAYDQLPAERRFMVKYEELLERTGEILADLYEWLGLEAGEEAVRAAVEGETFEAIPAEERGSGKFARVATPGLWRENRSEEEKAVMERIMGESLRRYGYS